VWRDAVDAQAGVGAAAHVRYRALPTTPAATWTSPWSCPTPSGGGGRGRAPALRRRHARAGVACSASSAAATCRPARAVLAWRLTLRDPARTLRQKEVEGRRQKLVQALERELGVPRRAAEVAGGVPATAAAPSPRSTTSSAPVRHLGEELAFFRAARSTPSGGCASSRLTRRR
jgi:hypothetical protein